MTTEAEGLGTARAGEAPAPAVDLVRQHRRTGGGTPAGAADTSLINRELSWLEFNSRVLSQAEDESLPLLERARFLAIASRGLDEFFQVRVGGLKQQLAARLDALPGEHSPRQQVAAIRARVEELYRRQADVFLEAITPELQNQGIRFSDWESLDDEDRSHLDKVFDERIFPVLTPLAVDPAHPFPYISTLSLNLAVVVADPVSHQQRIARVKVPPLLSRFVVLPDGERFVPIEQVISAHLGRLFEGMGVAAHHAFRLTRNADYQLEGDEADDLIEAVRAVLQQRRRSPLVIRLEVGDDMPETLVDRLIRELGIEADDVYRIRAPLDLGGLFELYRLDRPELKYRPATPVTPHLVEPGGPDLDEVDIFRGLRQEQIFVHHPYESFEATVEKFIERAAEDPSVLAIKQTLYRTSGQASPIIRSLTRAAESGKQVVALVELTARFDEQNNINWAEVLEDAGVHVVYGTVGLKTHAKVTLVVREEQGGIRRYCHVGTGNYNRDTARLYEDLGLLTADAAIGADVGELFNTLTGYSRQHRYRKLLVAPTSMRSALLELIAREGSRESGRIILKVNNLADPQVIEALYEASRQGTDIDLIVRSVCRLRPGVPGMSENIRVRSLVGRYLEHSRILRFGADPHDADFYISSADLMPRNLDRRVEVAVPIRSADLRSRLNEILDVNLADDLLAWELHADGSWTKVPTREGIDAQVRLQGLAQKRAEVGS